jgi:hypothetical protein
MIWIKLGILIIGFIYAGLLPYTLYKSIKHTNFDLSNHTLSYFSNKEFFGNKYNKAYKTLLFATAILTYIFFWLLSKYYDLGEYESLMRQVDYCCAALTLLAFVPHNILPLSIRKPRTTLQRLIHNTLAVIVFLSLPILIFIFQFSVVNEMRFLGVSGLILITAVFSISVISFGINGINGATELVFINGISIWNIYVTIITVVFVWT